MHVDLLVRLLGGHKTWIVENAPFGFEENEC